MLMLLVIVHKRERGYEVTSEILDKHLSRTVPDPSCNERESEAKDQRTIAEAPAEIKGECGRPRSTSPRINVP